jgi:ribonuclease HI
MESKQPVLIYTDGAARGNPGPGGYGAVLLYGPHKLELSEGFVKTTNNRMELKAVIEALKKIKKINMEVHVFTDSKYVHDAIEKGWLKSWVSKNFKDKKNVDLWKEYLEISKLFKVKIFWVKGHAGNPLNERCDFLATHAADNGPKKVDIGFVG